MLSVHARLLPNRVGTRGLERLMTFARWNDPSCRRRICPLWVKTRPSVKRSDVCFRRVRTSLCHGESSHHIGHPCWRRRSFVHSLHGPRRPRAPRAAGRPPCNREQRLSGMPAINMATRYVDYARPPRPPSTGVVRPRSVRRHPCAARPSSRRRLHWPRHGRSQRRHPPRRQ
jgi:hypothetical protein